jgi:fructose-1,6-bisphosphatase/inositol monophosphatase family enzyme
MDEPRTDLEGELEVASRLAGEAGAALRRYQASDLAVRTKAHGEIVTPADLEADAIIRNGLAAAFPDDAIFSEETADSPARLARDRVWIVDPLDSTSNFIEHGTEYSVSLGLAIRGRASLGVVYNPGRDELFAGYQGAGVTLNCAPVRVTDAKDLHAARLTVSRKEWRRGLDKLHDALLITPVASMAYKLARVAAGIDDGVFSMVPRKEWGTCAGVALVLAADGCATLLDGREIRFNRSQPRQPLGMVASGPNLHRLLLERFADLCSPELTASRDAVQ